MSQFSNHCNSTIPIDARIVLKKLRVVRFRFLEGFYETYWLLVFVDVIVHMLFVSKKYRATIVYKIALSGSVFDSVFFSYFFFFIYVFVCKFEIDIGKTGKVFYFCMSKKGRLLSHGYFIRFQIHSAPSRYRKYKRNLTQGITVRSRIGQMEWETNCFWNCFGCRSTRIQRKHHCVHHFDTEKGRERHTF